MPTWYETPSSPNQACCCSNCSPSSKSKRKTPLIQRPTSPRETSSASEPASGPGSGSSQTTSAPISGSRISVVVSQPMTYLTEMKTRTRIATPKASASA